MLKKINQAVAFADCSPSHSARVRLLCAFTEGASSCSPAGWRLSQLQCRSCYLRAQYNQCQPQYGGRGSGSRSFTTLLAGERGEIYSVRYDAVNAMLLNEFLKEHEAFVEEHLKVQQQKKEIDVLKTERKEQRALIQKVSDRIELKSSTSQIVANDQ
jgi:hypothetical protein